MAQRSVNVQERKKAVKTGPQIAQLAREQVTQLTGMVFETVSGLRHDPDGWHVSVEILEMKRIPAGTDVLGSYETLLDDDGMLVTCKRARRYFREERMSD